MIFCLSIIIVSACVTILTKESILKTLAPAVIFVALANYVFAFFRIMSWANWILVCLFVLAVIICNKGNSQQLINQWIEIIKSPDLYITLLVLLGLFICFRDYKVPPSDELNYITPYVRTMSSFNGIEGIYQSTNPDYSDYPMLVQLFMARAYKMWPYGDAVMAISYYFFGFALWLQIFRGVKIKWRTVPFILLVPFMGNLVTVSYYKALTADYLMSLVFCSAFMILIYGIKSKYDYLCFTAYLTAIAVMKQTGIILLGLIVVFYFIWYGITNLLEICKIMIFPILFYAHWKAYCALTGRKLGPSEEANGILKEIVTRKFVPNENSKQYIKAFVEAFVTRSVNGKGFLSVLLIICFIFLFMLALYRFDDLGKANLIKIIASILITACTIYGSILLMHLTIFSTEAQYVDPNITILTISRYGSPFAITVYVLVANYLLRKTYSKKNLLLEGVYWVLMATIILLLANNRTTIEGLWKYRDTVKYLYEEEASVEDEFSNLICSTQKMNIDEPDRILIFQPDGLGKYEYLYNLCAPISLVEPISTIITDYPNLIWNIDVTKSCYIFLHGLDSEVMRNINEVVLENGGEKIENDKLYRVEETEKGKKFISAAE